MNILINNHHHIFYAHLLQKKHLQPILKSNSELIWPSVFLLISLSLLVFLKVTSYSKVIRIIQSTFSSNALHELEREETRSFKLYSIILSLFFLLNLSFLFYKVNAFYKLIFIDCDLLFQFSIILCIVFFFSGLKFFISQLIRFLSNDFKTISDYSYNTLKINQTFGVFLFPWLVMAELSHFNSLIFISGAFVVMGASLVYRWYRGIIISLTEQKVGLLQTFTYFCGLEILPLLVLVKYIIETF